MEPLRLYSLHMLWVASSLPGGLNLNEGAPEVGGVHGVPPDASEGGSPSSAGNLDLCVYLALLGHFSLSSLRAVRPGTVRTSGKPVAALHNTDAER